MFDKGFRIFLTVAIIILLIFTVLFGILKDLDIAMLCFILAMECLILLDVENLHRKVEGK